MADLGTLSLGTASSLSLTTTTGVQPVLETIASFNDGTYVSDQTNSTHTSSADFALADMPADFKHMSTLAIRVRYLASGAQTNTWNSISAQVYKSDGSTILTFSTGVVTGPITNTAGINSAVATFAVVDTSASRTDWNGALVRFSWSVTRNKGGDTVQKRITAAELTGTYAIDTSIETFDGVTITEAVTLRLNRLVIDAFDTVTIAESLTLTSVQQIPPLTISSGDLVIVNEGQETIPKINVGDTVTVSESVLLVGALLPTVFDSILAQDSPAVTPLEITVPVEVSAFDTVVVNEGQFDITGPQLNVFDAVTIDDNTATIGMNLLRPTVFEVVTVVDFVNVPLGAVFPAVFDNVLVQEVRLLTITLKINCMDEVSVIDGAPSTGIIFDLVTVTDSVNVSIARLLASVFEQVNTSESVTVFLPTIPVSVFDLVTLTESVTVALVTVTKPLPTVFEDVTVAESVTVLLTKLKLTTFDDVLVEETRTTANITRLLIDVFDGVTVQEDVIAVPPFMVIDVNDAVTVVEDIILIPAILLIEQVETITITDHSTMEPLTVNIPNPAETEVFEDLLVTDVPTLYLTSVVPEAFDEVTVVEEITVFLTSINLTIDVFEDVTVTEDVSVNPTPLIINEFTQVFLDESVSVSRAFLVIMASEDVTVLEAVTVALSRILLNVSDDVTVSERVALRISRPGQSRRHQLPVVGVE